MYITLFPMYITVNTDILVNLNYYVNRYNTKAIKAKKQKSISLMIKQEAIKIAMLDTGNKTCVHSYQVTI